MAEDTKTVKMLFGCKAPLVNEIHLNLLMVLDVVSCAGWHIARRSGTLLPDG